MSTGCPPWCDKSGTEHAGFHEITVGRFGADGASQITVEQFGPDNPTTLSVWAMADKCEYLQLSARDAGVLARALGNVPSEDLADLVRALTDAAALLAPPTDKEIPS